MGSLVLIAPAFRSLSAERADFQGCSCRREDIHKRGKLFQEVASLCHQRGKVETNFKLSIQ